MTQLSDFAVTLIRYGFLALLWLFVLLAVSVMRRDLFGRASTSTPAARTSAPATPTQARQSKRGAPTLLVVTTGSLSGATMRLGEEPLTIGRGPDCTLVITDDYASTRHARLYARTGQWFVEDLGSTNGTYVDRMRITGPTPVPIGVPVRVGGTTVELRK